MWERVPNASNANNVGNVNTSGNVNNNNAYNGNRCAADCGFYGQKGYCTAMMLHETSTRSLHPEAETPEQHGGDGCAVRGGQPISAPTFTLEDVIGFDALWDSMLKCKSGVMWKDSVAHFVLNGTEEVARLCDELHNGTYKPRKAVTFTITNPKRREILSISFRDRVYQRSLNDNVVYPLMSRRWIYDNCACQVGKGTDFARNRLKCHMQRMYRKHGTDLHVLQIDISGYYPNMPHDVAKARFRADLPDWAYRRVEEIIDTQYEGDIGFNPGSQLVQIAGIAVLDPLDHFIKERLRVKAYVRYMDDLILIHNDRAFLEHCKDEIERELASIGFKFNPKKTRIYSISDGIPFLGFDFTLTDSGKVVMLVKAKHIKQARRRLKRFANLAKSGYRTRQMVDDSYTCYRNHMSKGGSKKLLRRMDAWYESLWR